MLVFYDLPPIPLQRHWPTSPLSTFYFGWSTLRIYFQVFKSEIAWKNVQLKKDSYQSKKREKPEKGRKRSYVRWFEQTKIESMPNKQSTVFRVLSHKFNCEIGWRQCQSVNSRWLKIRSGARREPETQKHDTNSWTNEKATIRVQHRIIFVYFVIA